MAVKKWSSGYAPLRKTPGYGEKILDVPTHGVVEFTGNQQDVMMGEIKTTWLEVKYRDFTGWTYAGFFEDYDEMYPSNEVDIENQTPEKFDFEQYFYYEGRKKYNMCGQLCVAWMLGIPVLEILERWKVGSPPFYKRIFGGTADRGTGTDDLDNLLGLYEFQIPCLRFKDGLKDSLLGRELVTPRRMEKMLETYQLIASVNISRASGNLVGKKEVLHWVVVDRVVADGLNRGFVEMYNPAPNRVQLYSWEEFIKSAGAPYGLWLPRRRQRELRNVLLK